MVKIWFHAAQTGSKTHLKLVYKNLKYVKVDSRTSIGQTALLLASAQGHLAAVEWLISKGADVNATDKYNETPLSLALLKNNLDCAKNIYTAGGRFNTERFEEIDERTDLLYRSLKNRIKWDRVKNLVILREIVSFRLI